MMDLCMITALWRRPRVSRYVLSYYLRLRPRLIKRGVRIQVIASVSPDDPFREEHTALAGTPGIHFVSAPNRPLSGKFNAPVRYAKHLDPDGVVVIGSDDLIAPVYFDRVFDYFRDGVRTMRMTEVGMYDLATDRGIIVRSRTGAGYIMNRDLLRMLEWEPWPRVETKGLDRALMERVQPINRPRRVVHASFDRGFPIIDIKTDENISPFDHFVEAWHVQAWERSPEELFSAFPPNVYPEVCQIKSSSA